MSSLCRPLWVLLPLPGCIDTGVHGSGDSCSQSAGVSAIRAGCHEAPDVAAVPDPWAVRTKWTYPGDESLYSTTTPKTGYLVDDNGDGMIGAGDRPRVVTRDFVPAWDTYSSTVRVLDGPTGALDWEVGGMAFGAGDVAIADVDGDGVPEVLASRAVTGEVLALTAGGDVLWESAPGFDGMTLTVADLRGDGSVSVLADDFVLDGVTGELIASLPAGHDWSGLTAADLDLDGSLSILQGGSAHAPDGSIEWTVRDGFIYYSFPLVLQADSDPEAEVVWVFDDQYSLWEADGTNIVAVPFADTNQPPGQPCAADFDGDGRPEIAIPATNELVLLRLDGTVAWTAPINDASAAAGCSGFDLDGDGAAEVLYADEDAFWILDGRTGAARYHDATRQSLTGIEYPVIADVDGDGHAEILLVSDSGLPALTVLENDGVGWPPAGPGWGLSDFAVTNIGASGQVPVIAEPSWQYFNMVRARPAADVLPLADLTVTPSATCDSGELRVLVSNAGTADVAAGAVVTATVDGIQVGSAVLPSIPAASTLDGVLIPTSSEVSPSTVDLTVDAADDVPECDDTNNTWVHP